MKQVPDFSTFADEVLAMGSYKNIASTRYTNDKQITDHYAIIPTGQGLGHFEVFIRSLEVFMKLCADVFSVSFYPPAQYRKLSMTLKIRTESFYASFKVLTEEGYLKVAGMPKKAQNTQSQKEDETEDVGCDAAFLDMLKNLKRGHACR